MLDIWQCCCRVMGLIVNGSEAISFWGYHIGVLVMSRSDQNLSFSRSLPRMCYCLLCFLFSFLLSNFLFFFCLIFSSIFHFPFSTMNTVQGARLFPTIWSSPRTGSQRSPAVTSPTRHPNSGQHLRELYLTPAPLPRVSGLGNERMCPSHIHSRCEPLSRFLARFASGGSTPFP